MVWMCGIRNDFTMLKKQLIYMGSDVCMWEMA